MTTLERYDKAAARVCASLAFDPASPAKLVPGYRFDANWTGPNEDHQPRKVWHWPVQSLPVVLRTFPGVTSADPKIVSMIARAETLNAARTRTVAFAHALARSFHEVRTKFVNGKSLLAHQMRGVQNTLTGGGARGLFHQTGTGKTITAGVLLRELTQNADGMRISVVVCPVTLIPAAWIKDLVEWFPELPFVNLRDYAKGQSREIAVASVVRSRGRCIALVNYETMRTDKSVRRIMSGAFVVFDEVSKCKNHKSSISVVAREMAPTFRGCVLLSGTPAPNGNEEYWPLAKILAPAAGYDPFPGGYSAFTKEFCEVKTFTRRRDAPGEKHFAGFEFKEELAARIHERLSPICEWVKKEECLDLPPKLFETVPVELTSETARAYEEMRDTLMTSVVKKYGNDLKAHAVNALAQMMKLRQITAGYVPAVPADWVAGTNKVMVPLGREKIDWLLERCETDTNRIVVWTQFVFEAARYEKELREKKFTCATITGLTPEKDRPEVFAGFVRGDFQVLVAHPGVAQWGVSFKGVTYAAYGSLSYSLQEFAQSQDRIHGVGRGDANQRSTFYLLAARASGERTIDDDCIDVLEGKKDALELVFDIDRERRGNGFVARDVGQRIGP